MSDINDSTWLSTTVASSAAWRKTVLWVLPAAQPPLSWRSWPSWTLCCSHSWVFLLPTRVSLVFCSAYFSTVRVGLCGRWLSWCSVSALEVHPGGGCCCKHMNFTVTSAPPVSMSQALWAGLSSSPAAVGALLLWVCVQVCSRLVRHAQPAEPWLAWNRVWCPPWRFLPRCWWE
jgi:hypothetical protein